MPFYFGRTLRADVDTSKNIFVFSIFDFIFLYYDGMLCFAHLFITIEIQTRFRSDYLESLADISRLLQHLTKFRTLLISNGAGEGFQATPLPRNFHQKEWKGNFQHSTGDDEVIM